MSAEEPGLPEPVRAQAPTLRVGDAEREATAERLRGAAEEGRIDYAELDERLTAAYAARVRGDLDALVADLPAAGAIASPPPAGAVTGGTGTRFTLSVMGGHRRTGVWRVAPHSLVGSVMGGSLIDLTEAEFSAPVTTLTVVSVMGGSRVVVPDGVRVEVSKLGIMGGHRVDLGGGPNAGERVLRIRLIAVMGGSQVRRAGQGRRPER